MAGAILAIGAAVSAATKNQVIAFVVTATLVFMLIAAGTPTVIGLFQGWAPEGLIHAVAEASLFGHFTAITRGVVDLRDLSSTSRRSSSRFSAPTRCLSI
jgi:ABC-2 type transport system permease protein